MSTCGISETGTMCLSVIFVTYKHVAQLLSLRFAYSTMLEDLIGTFIIGELFFYDFFFCPILQSAINSFFLFFFRVCEIKLY